MMARFLRWLGLTSSPARRPAPRKVTSATAHLFDKKPAAAQPKRRLVSREDDFNPYNTGKFDRHASWEKIGKKHR